MSSNQDIDGIEIIVETDSGAQFVFLKFSDMVDSNLVEYVLKFPRAMTEWMNRLDRKDAELEEQLQFILESQQLQGTRNQADKGAHKSMENVPVPDMGAELYIYVDNSSRTVDAMFFQTLIGITIRQDNEWVGVFEQKTIDELTANRDCYVLNWDKSSGNEPEDVSDDYDDEHEAVYLFDKGELSLENLETWFDLAYKAGEGITGSNSQE